MIIEDSDIDLVQPGLGLLDGSGRNYLVALLAKNCGTQDQILLAVVEQQNANRPNRNHVRFQYRVRDGNGNIFAHVLVGGERTQTAVDLKHLEKCKLLQNVRRAAPGYSSFFPAAAFDCFCVRLRTAFAISGSLLNALTARNHCLCSKAGDPLTMLPAGMSPWVPLCAVMTTPSPTLQCPATPACPAMMTFLPTTVEPARPTWAHSNVCSPTAAPCPTWVRLSIFTPRAMRVSPTLARSMQALA